MFGKIGNLSKYLCFVLFTICMCLAIHIICKNHEKPAGNMIFLDWNTDSENYANLMKMDTNGNNLQILTRVTGTVAWNPDGKHIATGCDDENKRICIYNIKRYVDYSLFPPVLGNLEEDIISLAIPNECINVLSSTGVSSISWSNDGEKLIIVCGNQTYSDVCILSIAGESNCWGVSSEENYVSRADWSPNDDLIVIDRGQNIVIADENGNKVIIQESQIQIVDEKGDLVENIANGFSPAWSPDGKQIAFFHWDEEMGDTGIASVSPDGKKSEWIFRSPSRKYPNNNDDIPSFVDYKSCMQSSKLSWSPDMRYLFTDGLVYDWCTFRIFRIDVKSGEIVSLTTNLSFLYQEPAVQP